MRFLPTDEQADFARTLRSLLAAADVPAAVRDWAGGRHGPGRTLWSRLADTGLFALAVPEAYEGLGPLPPELALGFVELGRAGVPGPVVETAAACVLLAGLDEEAPAKRFLPALAGGGASATLTLPGGSPYALDADAASYCFTVSGAGELRLAAGGGGPLLASTDPARRLSVPPAGGELLAAGPRVLEAARTAARWARLLTAAQCLGVGEALLARTVEYAKRRTQFGVPIGGFQAVKHRLADTLLGLEFARPLVWAAALSLDPADVAAAKLTAGESAYRAAMSALQLHGAVGYTEELDLSLWLRKARPLRDAWGTPSACRAEVLAAPRPRGR
ncbi:acyl-CoA dehydrogenase family protein [Streptomyces antarcticus]|uniref:acyl-CoA dehydrogenase family protein n=1 Tax=Streptomyces antarcticus TaxID=2996458 RepID=UPI00226DC403|nr:MULTISPECIES: acyl-CoA dehydrogenase family protein [unclassified Streptomyces]MCY0942837.1 acyl-CoA/acyl-ACP dehydrogenase [Streptomyces sp. H34-AA3]MCZ4085929.1 acyl-CoA/acyl-ACP dehydrogenase [Streptomyces sp. H34-S5]